MELESKEGLIPADLERILPNIKEYSFFRLVPLLTDLAALEEDRASWSVGRNKLYFKSSTGLGFPSSDIDNLKILENKDFSGNPNLILLLTTNFLGAHGVDSPLPAYFSEEALRSSLENGVMCEFLDFFNNRLIGLLYKSWLKYRYYARFEKKADDMFSDYIFAMFGVYDKQMRLSSDNISWGKMLAYAGVFSSRCRSPDVLENVISHIFDFPLRGVEVFIECFCLRRVEIPIPQRWKLGSANSVLSMSAIIGSKVPDRSGKFKIIIKKLSFDFFQDFLPGQDKFLTLVKLVEFMLKEQFAYDLVLELLADQAPPITLEKNSTHRLGWSSFLGSSSKTVLHKQVTLQVLV